ncbi:hypothetical protein IIC38_16190 [candidate division KSB1 bacterium]|nr:hypothetical protein [candidate division KSB1 bacterium]
MNNIYKIIDEIANCLETVATVITDYLLTPGLSQVLIGLSKDFNRFSGFYICIIQGY